MAAILNAASEGLVRTTNLIPFTGAATHCWWADVEAHPVGGNFLTLFYHGDDPATLYADYVWFGYGGAGDLLVDIAGTAGQVQAAPGRHHFAYVRDADALSHRFYMDGELVISVSHDVSAFANTHLYLGTDTFAADWDEQRIWQYRSWSAALTAAQIASEMAASSAVLTTDLHVDTPLELDLDDESANDYDWSLYQSTTFEDTVPDPVYSPRHHGFAFRSVSAVATGTTALTIAAPAGIQDNDLLVLTVAHKSNSPTAYLTPPSGFLLVAKGIPTGGTTRGEMYYKRASSESGSYSVTGMNTVCAGYITCYEGAKTGSYVLDVANIRENASGTTGTDGVTTNYANSLVLFMVALGSNTDPESIGTRAGNSGRELYDSDFNRCYRRQSGGSAVGGAVSIAHADASRVLTGEMDPWTAFISGNPENVCIQAVFRPAITPTHSGTYYFFGFESMGERPEQGFLKGQWRSTYDQPIGWATEPRTNRMRQERAGLGTLVNRDMHVNQQGDYDVCVGRYMTPRLAAQTISGTIDIRWFIGQWWDDLALGAINSSVVRTKLHVYITKGQTTDTRTTLLNHVETTNWPFDASQGPGGQVKGLASAQTLTSAVCQEGDSVCVEVGFRIVSSPTPTPHYPPDEWTGIAIEGFGGANPNTAGLGSPTTHSPVAGLVSEIGTDVTTSLSHLRFSMSMVEAPPDPDDTAKVPTNQTWQTAIAITDDDLPYCSADMRADLATSPTRELWWEYTPEEASTVDLEDGTYLGAKRLGLFGFGSNHAVEIKSFFDSSGDNLTPNDEDFNLVLANSGGAGIHRAEEALWNDVVADRRYWIRVRTEIQSGGTPATGGGAVRFGLIRERAPQEDDIYLATKQVLALDQCGNLVNHTGAFSSSAPTGVAIDYTERPMSDLTATLYPNDAGHQRPRLLVGLHNFDLVEIVDLATLAKGHGEIDWYSNNLDAAPAGEIMSNLQTTHDLSVDERGQFQGTELVVAWFGDGYQHVTGAPPLPSFLNNVSESANTGAPRGPFDMLHGDNQPEAPFADADINAAAVQHTTPNKIALGWDNRTLYYTSGGHYVPVSQIGGTTTDIRADVIKVYDLVTDTQGADIGPITLEPGFNPGLRNLVLLPADKGILVINGSRVDWIRMDGTPVRSYRPMRANNVPAYDLTSLALNSDGESFWTYDAESAAMFKFNLFSSAQVRCVETFMVQGVNAQLTVYTPNGIKEPCW